MKAVVIPAKSVHSGKLILVNAQHPYRDKNTDGTLVTVCTGSEILLERRAAVLFDKLMTAINGWPQIDAVSGWRSHREQQSIYLKSLLQNGIDFTKQYVAKPGHSEHQTGLAIDLGLSKSQPDFIRPDFPYSGICRKFREKAAEYGFIERYPKGKEAVTGIAHEPWHFRYVGAPHAAVMTRLDLTLEEYSDFIKQYRYGENYFPFRSGAQLIKISYLKAETGDDLETELDDSVPYSVSGNNTDGFILTEWGCGDDR